MSRMFWATLPIEKGSKPYETARVTIKIGFWLLFDFLDEKQKRDMARSDLTPTTRNSLIINP